MREIITYRWFRKIMLWVSHHIFNEQILELLYPNDLIISFGDSDCLDGSEKND